MTTVQITSPSGQQGEQIELPDAIFDATANVPLMHQVVVAQLAAARQGTHKTKTRGEVRGGGKKPYRQKGTGRARQGSTRAPQFNGGGVVHGPVPHGYSQRTPKKMKAAALRGALSDRARGGHVHVLSSLVEGDRPSTKTARAALAAVAALSSAKNILVVLSHDDETGWLSLRNVPEVHLLTAGQLNTYDVLVSDEVVFIRAALDEFLAHAGASSSIIATEQAPAEPTTPAGEAEATPATGRHAAADADQAPVDDAAPGAADAPATDEAPTDEAPDDDAAPSLEKDPADEAEALDETALAASARTTTPPSELDLESSTAAGGPGTTAGASSVSLTPDSTDSQIDGSKGSTT
jgi:large subunit ribosomal protein L4